MKKFRSTTGLTERICLPDGGVALVGTSWVEIPPKYHKGAYALGCESDDQMETRQIGDVSKEQIKYVKTLNDKAERIRQAILVLLEENDPSLFTTRRNSDELIPKSREITKRADGVNCTNADRDRIWYKMLEEGIQIPGFD